MKIMVGRWVLLFFWLNKFNDTTRGENGWQVRGDVYYDEQKKQSDMVAQWHVCRDTGYFYGVILSFFSPIQPRCAGRSRKKRRWNLYNQILFCSGKYSTLYNAIGSIPSWLYEFYIAF